ncbi:MAG TPA: 3,4-dihydroxy-2-butanone-4-phosphate synthase, partial [Conexibacter sp.]
MSTQGTQTPFATVEEAIEDIRQGKMVVVCDDEDRENEGDLTIAAEKVTPEVINFMARYGRGLICLPMTGERLDALRIPLMVRDEQNDAKFGTAFCVPIEAKIGTTTG